MKQAVRQTRTHIRELLARQGISPRHDLGQNFLIDLNLLEFLVAEAQIGPEDVVLEVGSGTGGLTTFLAQQAAAVIAVEVDRRMQQLTAAAVEGLANVTLLGCDVLQNKNHFSRAVLDALEASLSVPSRRLRLVANLPYCVATPVIANLVATDYPWDRMVVTIQHELAQRMNAREGTADYGALSAWMQAQCQIKLLKRLPPDVFWPRPKVESAMICIEPDRSLREAIRDRTFLHSFLRDVFQHRRKLLRSACTAAYRKTLSRAQIDELLRSQALGERARAEELSPATLVRLCNALVETVRQHSGADV